MGGYLAYTNYKDSGVEWLGEIPVHWMMSKAKFVSKIFIPQRNKPELNTDGEGLPWLTMDDMSGDRVSNTSFKVSEESAVQAGSRVLQKGSVVASCVGNFGVTAINEVDVIINQQLQAFIPTTIDSDYLRLTVSISSDYFKMRATAATIEYVNQAGFANIPLALPPIEEQRSIARFLDYKTAQIDALVAKKETLLKKLAEKRTALISQAVTKGCDRTVPMKDSGIEWLGEIPAHWNVLQIKRAFVLQRGVDITKEEQSEGEVPVVSSGGIFSYHDTAYAKAPGVIVGRKGTLGKVYYLEQDYWPHDTTLYVIHFYTNYPRFIYYKLLSMQLETWDTGSANPTLNRNLIHPVKTPCPLVEEQVQIVDYLDSVTTSINHQTETINLAIAKLKEYRTALITNAVTGKIDVRDVILELEPVEAA